MAEIKAVRVVDINKFFSSFDELIEKAKREKEDPAFAKTIETAKYIAANIAGNSFIDIPESVFAEGTTSTEYAIGAMMSNEKSETDNA